jgi:U3 small nucleolar RNA-associated protein 13
MAGRPASSRLALKRKYERAASIEPFFSGGALALSRDGDILACTCGGEVKILDVKTGAVRASVEADAEQVTALALSPNGQELITAGRDFMVRTWELPSGTKLRSWKASQGLSYVQRFAYDETSTLAAGGCSDGVVRVWDSGRGFATHSLRGHSSVITSVCFGATPRTDPNKLLLFSGSEDGEVRVWALATKTCKAVLKNHDSAVTAMALHVPTRSLVTGGRDRVVNVWDLKKLALASSVPIYDTIEGMVVVTSCPAAEPGKPAAKKKSNKSAAGEDEKLEQDLVADVKDVKDIEFVTAGVKGVLKRWRVGGGKCLLR